MTTDRELLELAAKAAGIDVKYAPGGNADGADVLRIVYKRDGYHDWLDREWNPLTDDGDCARMEAVLETEIQWHEDGVQAGKRSNPISVFCFYADYGGDKNATRRAASVTFAASTIGEKMP